MAKKIDAELAWAYINGQKAIRQKRSERIVAVRSPRPET
jgi:hypothetical protein